MKSLNKLPKKIRVISLMILLVLVSATSIAFLKDYSDIVNNTFSLKSIHTNIEEVTDTDLSKIPFVKNTGKTDAMVRVRIIISGDFEGLALSGIGNLNYSNAYFHWGNATKPATYSNSENNNNYWYFSEPESNVANNEYIYYYKRVLYAEGTQDDDNNPLDVTQPVFDKIVLTDGTTYDNATDEQKKIFNKLANVQISIYQESVPLSVYDKDNGKILYTAEVSDGNLTAFSDNSIFENSQTLQIWNYFKNTENINNE